MRQFESKNVRFLIREHEGRRTVLAEVDLGGNAGRCQRTIKYMPGGLEAIAGSWMWISVATAYNDGQFWISFDGKNYGEAISVKRGNTLELRVRCKAIRVRPARRSRKTAFTVLAVE